MMQRIMAAPLRAAPHCALFTVALVLAAFVQHNEAVDFTIDVVVMHVEGNLTLPDPGPLNAFLAQNASLSNPLLASHSPLQLQICNSTVYKKPFDFYTIQHPGGCAEAPGVAKDAKQRKQVQSYEKLCWTWHVAFFGLLLVCFIGRQLCSPFKKCVDKAGSWIREVLGLPKGLDDSDAAYGILILAILAMVAGFGGLAVGLPLYMTKFGADHFYLVELPGPPPLNLNLSTSGENVTLYLCTIRSAFQVYLGFAETCNLGVLQESLYPGYNITDINSTPHNVARSGGVLALMIVGSILMFSTWTFVVAAVVWGCLRLWYLRVFFEIERKVYDIELPDSGEDFAQKLLIERKRETFWGSHLKLR